MGLVHGVTGSDPRCLCPSVRWVGACEALFLASIVNSSKMNAEAEVNRFGLFMNCIQARVSFKNASKFNNG